VQLVLYGIDIKASTHTGVFPACDRVTRIDMADVGVVVVARYFRGGRKRKEPQQQDTTAQTRMKDAQKRFYLESHSWHFAIAADGQWHRL
jgi:hypothetical protein